MFEPNKEATMPDFIKYAEEQEAELDKKNKEEQKDRDALTAQIEQLRKDLQTYLKSQRKKQTLLDMMNDGKGVRLQHGTRELFVTMTRKDRYLLKHVVAGEVEYGKSSESSAVDEKNMMGSVIEWLKAAR